ncbi:MAG: metal-dependent hydrolase [Promethearchaeota archaeon]
MHVSFHYAFGVILAGLGKLFFNLPLWMLIVIILLSIIPDIDYILSRNAPNHNHRMLLTHSIYIPLVLIILGFIISQPVLWIGGLGYLSHVCFDLLDWGTNLFMTGKIIGIRILLDKKERAIVPELMKKEIKPKWFFVRRYFSSIIILSIEIITGLGMLSVLIWLIPQYWYLIFGYILVGTLHLTEFVYLRFQCKKTG